MNYTILYHANCNDGFTSAWVANKAIKEFMSANENSIKIIPVEYGKPAPEIKKNETVLILDFSYSEKILKEMLNQAKSILVIDHHKTAQEQLKNISPWSETMSIIPDEGLYTIFDMEKSGAMLTFKHFYPDIEVPNLINYVQDRDLFKIELPLSKEFTANLMSHEHTIENWQEIYRETRGDIGVLNFAKEGESILRKYQKDIVNYATENSLEIDILDFKGIPIINCPPHWASDIGAILAKEKPFSISFFYSKNSIKFSLRSEVNACDVSNIAKLFGGGGHKNAAGFSLPQESVILNVLLKMQPSNLQTL